jgi:hypothetical protein
MKHKAFIEYRTPSRDDDGWIVWFYEPFEDELITEAKDAT